MLQLGAVLRALIFINNFTCRRRCVHVTNYSVNKHQPGFVANTDASCDGVGNKWTLRALRAHLEAHCGVQWKHIWSQVRTSSNKCDCEWDRKQRMVGCNGSTCKDGKPHLNAEVST